MATDCRKSQGSDALQRSFGRTSNARMASASDKPRTARSEAAVRRTLVGLALTGACVGVICQGYLSNRNGAGTHWALVSLVALLFLLVALPHLVVGIKELRSGRSPDAAEAGGKDRMLAFVLLCELMGTVVMFFWAIIGFFVGLFE